MNYDSTVRLIEQGIREEIFPCAAFAIGRHDEVLKRGFMGNRSLFPEIQPLLEDSLFDMASLTKILSTTMLALKAVESGRISLADRLSLFFDQCYDKGDISIKQLMTHTSGIAAHFPLYEMNIRPDETIDAILKMPLAYKTGSAEVYSCMGFILLGKILERVYGDRLDKLARHMVFEPLGMKTAGYCPVGGNTVSTEYSSDLNAYINGVVHDENARFLGGVSGNAGVFASLDDMIAFCAMLSRRGKGFLSERIFERAVENYTPGMEENRGLGFILNGSPLSFAGDLFSDGSYGHTGFTGTSVMVDNKTGLYAVLLTNRVHYGRENEKLFRFRRQFHNSIWGNTL